VALPAEHGGWGFLTEAVCLSLLVAPGPATVPLAGAAVVGFLAHPPLRIWLTDRLRGRSVPRTGVAARLAGAWGAIGAGALGLALLQASHPGRALVPLGLAAGLGAFQISLDLRGRGRSLLAELLGAGALGGLAAAAAAARGDTAGVAALPWALLVGRAVPAVVLVRARLRQDRGGAADSVPVHATHAAALLGSGALAGSGLVSLAVVAVFGALWIRAAVVIAWRRPLRPQTLGMMELGIGLAAVVALGAALRAGP
jgi:hypothetical protein